MYVNLCKLEKLNILENYLEPACVSRDTPLSTRGFPPHRLSTCSQSEGDLKVTYIAVK